jgi:4-hydroxy-tetrahydrodipicolinate synthase
MLTGSLVALVTPMLRDGALDLPRLHELIDWHVHEGTAGIVIVGTTGESPTVDVEEHTLLIRSAVQFASGRIPVIAGTGANSTREAIHLARAAKAAGADLQLSVVPYYNKPTQEGLFQHFKAVAEATDLPLIVYNVPGRTVADLEDETLIRLAALPNVVGVKDATGNVARGSALIGALPEGFAIYSGDDITACALLLLGAHGTISVTANIAPRLMSTMCKAALAGDARGAAVINRKLLGLHRALFVEANPIPSKWALCRMGRIQEGIRLPLTPLSPEHHAKVLSAMAQAEIEL